MKTELVASNKMKLISLQKELADKEENIWLKLTYIFELKEQDRGANSTFSQVEIEIDDTIYELLETTNQLKEVQLDGLDHKEIKDLYNKVYRYIRQISSLDGNLNELMMLTNPKQLQSM